MRDCRAAILCSHVADGSPVLLAVRDCSENKEDSGWQFLCNLVVDDPEQAKVWLIYEILERDNSINEIINCPTGTVAMRHSEKEPWVIRKKQE